MRDLIVRTKIGGGYKLYVWFNRETGRYDADVATEPRYWAEHDWLWNDLPANQMAETIFEVLAYEGRKSTTPVKFYIRRAKAGIVVIEHAKANGL